MWFLPQPRAPGRMPELGESLAFLWDEAARESYPLPGAGKGGFRGFPFDKGWFLINRIDGTVQGYNVRTGARQDLDSLNQIGFVLIAVPSGDGRTVALAANPDGLPVANPGTRAFLWLGGVLAELPKVSAVGRQNGGLDYLWLSADAKVLTFATIDGGVFLCSLESGLLEEVVEARITPGIFKRPAINADGSKLAWIAGVPFQTFFVIDVATVSTPAGTLYRTAGPARLLPEVRVENVPPKFNGVGFGAKGQLYFSEFDLGTGDYFLKRYDYEAGRVAQLTTLNIFEDTGTSALSDSRP